MSGFLKQWVIGCQGSQITRFRRILADQRGTALVLSLIMLVVLSLLGALALNTSDTELGISGNHRANVEAFCVAERAVEYARSIVFAGNASSGYTLTSAQATQVEAGLAYGSLTAGSITAIDLAGSKECPLDIGSAGAECRYFRINVTAEGAKGAEVNLEVQVAEETGMKSDNRYDL